MITRLRITNFRGIAALEHDVPRNGVVAKGSNGKGKTSILKAIRAALAGNDIGPDAIRNGADKAEILVDLDNVQVRRAITKKGGGLMVTQDLGGGVRGTIASPQAYLTNLLGTAPLDPLDLFLAKPKDRRSKILAALPVTVTEQQLRAWVPELPDGFDCSGHGLEVLERLRKAHYDARTEANAAAKKAKADADRAEAMAGDLAKHWQGVATSKEHAVSAQWEATRTLTDLEGRETEAIASEERSAKSRARVSDLRERAKREVEGMSDVPADEVRAAMGTAETLRLEVERIEKQLAGARDKHAKADLVVTQLQARAEQVKAAKRRRAELNEQAEELEAAIAEAAVARPTTEEIGAARVALEAAKQLVNESVKAQGAIDARTSADELAKAADEAARRANRLDDIVTTLANDAPAALLAGSDGIPGLSLEGEDIMLDGVSLEALSGAEQLRFAVEIARRANARSKILVVDGLERLDPDQYDAFVKYATAGDYQLIASRVDKGEIVLEAIEAEPANGVVAHAAGAVS